MRRTSRTSRRGTVLPLLGVCLIGLFTFVALAIDLGLLAVSRTQCQNAADVSALVACRTLNNKQPDNTAYDNNRPAALQAGKDVVTGVGTIPGNANLSEAFTTSQITTMRAGTYDYNTTTQKFEVTFPAAPAAGRSWTAIEVIISTAQPTYFMKVMGVSSMPTGARAVAVHRPRDTAFVLDMTGSMAFSSTFNFNNQSMNPDDLVPSFGHYTAVQPQLIASSNQANGSGEAISRNNYCITTPGGPPIIRNFYYDAANESNPSNPAYPVSTTGTGSTATAVLKNAFHRWSPPESGGNSATYTPVTYDFSGYTANGTNGPTPAPDTFKTMTDGGGVTYAGDRWRRANGAIDKATTSWGTGSTSTKAATTAIELLGYNVSGTNVRGGTAGTTTITTEDKFRDPVWETYGYDLDIVKYRAWKGNSAPTDTTTYLNAQGGLANILLPTADQFQGYSMGPGYWGKTFFCWPPDPRPGMDWRRKFFLRVTAASAVKTGSGTTVTTTTAAFDPQGDNHAYTAGTNGINMVLFRNASGMTMTDVRGTQSISTTDNTVVPPTISNQNQTVYGYQINYPAVLAWIKSGGPMTLPPNLRAGRVLYYSSVPDDVDTSTGNAQQQLDKVFWKNYIDFVFGAYFDYDYNNAGFLYGAGDGGLGSGFNRSIYTADLNTWTGPGNNWPSLRPYMRYNDSPNRPRLHFWFGPLSMVEFIADARNNWQPGTCNEAQCWQLKAGMNSVVGDLQNNHPNDAVGLVMFAYSHHKDIRVPMGQDFIALKNALFYPKSLLNTIRNASTSPPTYDASAEIRPYTSSFASIGSEQIPNANGSTDPNTGLMFAFNLLSPSANLPSQYGTVKGRRGASKVVIFETDGVPNAYSSFTLNLKGYDTYYSNFGNAGNPGNGNATTMNAAYTVVQQIVKTMSSGNTSGVDSGLSLPNAPAKVYPIGFGDLFDVALAPSATFRPTAHQFLSNIGIYGGTLPAGTTTLPTYMTITGTYQQRIDTLKDCMERIFASGIAVTLIE